MTSSARWFLPVLLALLLGVLFLFHAAPAHAQDAVVWSTELTVQQTTSSSTDLLGCHTLQSQPTARRCSNTAVLGDDEFSYKGVSYTINRIVLFDTGLFILNLNRNLADTLKELALRVEPEIGDSVTLLLAANTPTNRFQFPNTGLSWVVGYKVRLSLVTALTGLTASSATSAGGTYSALTLSPTFPAATANYTATVANSVTHVKLTPTVSRSNHRVTVGKDSSHHNPFTASGTASQAIAMAVGANVIRVQVFDSRARRASQYTVTVTRRAPQGSSNANLSGLTASSATSSGGTYSSLTLSPAFDAATTSYAATVANSVTHVKLTPTVSDSNAMVEVRKGSTGSFATVSSSSASAAIPVSEGTNAITVRVRAQNGTVKNYTVTVTRQAQHGASGADLSGLVASAAGASGTYSALALSPAFNAATTSYTATVPNATTDVKLAPTVSDANAMVGVRKGASGSFRSVISGQESGTISLDVGANVITVRVTAQNGTVKNYTVTITRRGQGAPPPNTGGTGTGGGGAPPTEQPPPDPCGESDTEDLESFYDATGGDNWNDNTNWNSEEPLDQWFGVKTDEEERVISLRLADNNLSGDMPTEELLCLTELKELALWDNELSGEVPDELVQAVERAVLRDVAEDLSLNPEWFDDYENLFNFSDWHGGVTTDDEGRVTELDFTGEDITGEIPQSVFELKRLTAIETGCKVTVDPVPERVRVTMPEGCSDASLENIEISPGELEFDPMDLSYEVPVGYGPVSVTVTPTASESEAVITVNGETVQSETPYTVALEDDGETAIEIVVTAPDGMTTRTYEITVTRCGEDDIWALSRFYEAVGGQNWNDNTNWNSEEPLDRWFGVGTDEEGRVISLHLEGNGLSGKTPRELVCLSELKELALWDNELSGEVPEELALAVERAVLRDVAEALSLNTEWFDDYEDPFNFSDWHEGVTTDHDGRVTELDFTAEDIEGVIPGSVFELQRLAVIETECGVTLEVEAPGRVNVMMADDCVEETVSSGGGGCALSQGDSSVSGFGLFLVTILVLAALGRKRARSS